MLDGAMGVPFTKLSPGNQLKVVEGLEGTPFFDSVRAATLGALYTNNVVARHFGSRARRSNTAAISSAASTISAGCPAAGQRIGRRDNGCVFDLGDATVVVVIGSGAGGGTLANELAPKGIDVVCSRRAHALRSLTSSMTSGSCSTCSAGSTSPSGGRPRPSRRCGPARPWAAPPCTGRAIARAFQPHEFKIRTTYGDLVGASLIDWPLSDEDILPYYEKAEAKMGDCRPRRPAAAAGQQQFQGDAGRRQADRLHAGAHGLHGDQLDAHDDRPACRQIGFCMQACAIGAKWSTLYTEIPRAERPGGARSAPRAPR